MRISFSGSLSFECRIIWTIFVCSALERWAKEAKWQAAIDEAKAARNKVLAFDREYVPLKEWQEMFADLLELACRRS